MREAKGEEERGRRICATLKAGGVDEGGKEVGNRRFQGVFGGVVARERKKGGEERGKVGMRDRWI